MKSLAVIVARGSSKRLPRKNLKKIGGYSIVQWVAKAALNSEIQDVVISTEDKEITNHGEKVGLKSLFTRPKHLTKDFALDLDILLHAVNQCEKKLNKKYDVVCYIQPTTPFLRSADINKCLYKLKRKKLSCVFTSKNVSEHPKLMWKYKKKFLIPFLKEKIKPEEQFFQKLEKTYLPNGGIWCMKLKEIKKQKTLYADPIDTIIVPSKFSVDIDNEEDLILAKISMKKYNIKVEN